MYSFQAHLLATSILSVRQINVAPFLAWRFRVERIAGKMLGSALTFCVFFLLGCFPSGANAALDQWTAVGPIGAGVNTLAFDRTSPSIIYAGTGNNGVFKSTDSGLSWGAINNGLFHPAFGVPGVVSIAVDPSSPALYAGAAGPIGGMFKSTNGGASWSRIVNGLHLFTSPPPVLSIAIDRSNPSTLYVGTDNDGAFKSTDGGDTWRAIRGALNDVQGFYMPPDVPALVIDPSNPSTLYAGIGESFAADGRGIFKSIDAGGNWLQINNGLPSRTRVLSLLIDGSSPSILYAGTSGQGVFKSTDGGTSWQAINAGLTNFTVQALVMDPSRPSTLYAATFGQGVFRSSDSGANWSALNNGLINLNVLSLAIDPTSPSNLYAVTLGGGVFKITVSDVVGVPVPARLTARVGNLRTYLQWGPLPRPVDRYNIYVERFDTNANAFNSLGIISPPAALTLRNTFDVFQLPNGEFSQNGQLYRFRVSAVKNNVEGSLSDFVLARPGQFAVSQAPSRPANPILFLHGICLFESFPTNATSWDTTKDFFTNTLGWRFGGELYYSVNDDPRLVPPQIRGGFLADGNLYTVTFGNCQATYPDGGGLVHQGNEVRGFVQALSNHGVAGKVSLIAHSMGGIAARRYLAARPDEARNRIAELITYGSPHWGAPYGDIGDAIQSGLISNIPVFANLSLADLLPVFRSGGARDTTVQCLNGQIDFSSNAFLNNLRSVPLPSGIRYFSIRGHSHDYIDHLSGLPAPSSLLNCVSDHWDIFIPLDSADLGAVPNGAPARQIPLTQGTVGLLTTNRNHLQQTGDFSAILCALDPRCFVLTTRSPVDVEITAPDGRSLGKQLTEIPGAAYMELDDEIGHPIATTMIVFPLPGDYAIKVTPKTGAASTDTYTIEITRDGITTLLVQNQQLRDIPPQGFVVTVSPENKTPVANAGLNQTVRLGSIIRLNGSASLDPDRGPSPLTYSWAQTSGPSAALTGNNSATPSFIASVAGEYIFTLNVSDGQASSAPSSVNITVPLLGDIDLNGDVDNNDLNLVLAARNKPASGPNDLRDLDGDGIITALDARKLTLLCTRARCAVQ